MPLWQMMMIFYFGCQDVRRPSLNVDAEGSTSFLIQSVSLYFLRSNDVAVVPLPATYSFHPYALSTPRSDLVALDSTSTTSQTARGPAAVPRILIHRCRH